MLQALVKIWRFLRKWGPLLFSGVIAFFCFPTLPGFSGLALSCALFYVVESPSFLGQLTEDLLNEFSKRIDLALQKHTPEERNVLAGLVFVLGVILILGCAPLAMIGIGSGDNLKDGSFLAGLLVLPSLVGGFLCMALSLPIRGGRKKERRKDPAATKE